MKFTKKLITLIVTAVASLALSACIIVPSDDSTASTSVTPENYNVTVNSQTISEPQYSSLVEMLDAVRPSVVEIYTQSSTAVGTGAGSGIIVSQNAYGTDTNDTSDDYTLYLILTCHHVIDGTDNFIVKDIDGNQFTASLIGGDPESDVAVLKIKVLASQTSKLAVATFRDISDDKNPLKVGEDVVAIGNPLGTLGGTVTKGIISTIKRSVNVEGQQMELIQTDCSINSGNSGGGLFDMQGRLVGVVNAGYTGLQGLNFAIPVDDALEIYESLVETYNPNYGYVSGRARVAAENAYNLSFGYDIAFGDYSTNMFSYYTFVMGIKSTSVYYKAGLRAGDYVTAVSYKGEKRTVQGAASSALVEYLNSLKVQIGDQVTFTVVRNGSSMELTVTYEQFIYGDNGKGLKS